jgi:hypothetical protein
VAAIDFTTWTEVDPADRLVVTESKIDVTALEADDASTSVYYDYGAGAWGDFIVRLKITISDLEPLATIGVCGQSANYNNFYDVQSNGEGLYLGIQDNSVFEHIFIFDETTAGYDQIIYGANGLAGQSRWVELERAGTTFTAKVYTDAFSTLEDTLTITCAATKHRYMFFSDAGTINPNIAFTGSTEDWSIEAGTPGPAPAIIKVTKNFGMVNNHKDMYTKPALGMGRVAQ